MLAIRLARVGKKNTAQYKIVLQEHTVAPGGRHVEILGSYDPHSKKAIIKDERVKYWIEKGAQASDTAYNLLVSKGVISSKKRTVKMPKKVAQPATEVKTEGAKPVEATAQVKPEAPVETKPEEIKSEEKKTEETKPVEEKVEEKKTEEVKAEEPKKE